MDTTSFLLGMLTIIGVILTALIVAGVLAIVRIRMYIRNLQSDIINENTFRNNMFDRIEQRILDIERDSSRRDQEITSYVDSRIDKALMEKKKSN